MALRILGIDPGTLRMGYGLVQEEEGGLRYLDSGVLTAPASLELPQRLHRLHQALTELVARCQPQELAVEDPFVPRLHQGRAAMALGQAQGVAFLAAAAAGIPVQRYSPAQVKHSVAGYGASDKAQMQEMVQMLLELDNLPSSDAADALAVAICHWQHRKAALLIEKGRSP